MKTRTKIASLVGATALISGSVVATGIAMASIPNSTTGVITACRVTGDAGNVRIIDKEAGASCHSYETEISWAASSKLNNYEQITDSFAVAPSTNNGIASDTVTCSSGNKVVGGGYSVPDGVWGAGTSGSNMNTWASYPSANNAWTVKSKTQSGSTLTVTVYAICAAG